MSTTGNDTGSVGFLTTGNRLVDVLMQGMGEIRADPGSATQTLTQLRQWCVVYESTGCIEDIRAARQLLQDAALVFDAAAELAHCDLNNNTSEV